MKKFFLIVFFQILFSSLTVNGFNYHIQVNVSGFHQNFVTVAVGDTIWWENFTANVHGTYSQHIPSGAAPWNKQLGTFVYIVMVPGTYDYGCTAHSTHSGGFNAFINDISTTKSKPNFILTSEGNSVFRFTYNLNQNSEIRILLNDMSGKLVKILNSENKSAGEYNEVFYLADLRKGIYILQFISENYRYSRKIVIE